MRNIIKTILAALALWILWIGITSAIYRFSNPSATETQAFLHIPKSMMFNFKE